MTPTMLRSPVLWLTLALALTIALRGWLAQEYLMLGDDTVRYLDYSRALLGEPASPEWWTHAVGAAYILPFILVLGAMPGAWLAALVASALPAIPLYLLGQKLAGRPVTAFCAILFVWMPGLGALLASSWLYLLSITWGLLALFWLIRHYETAQKRYLALALLCGLLVAFTNQSALLVFAPVFWVLLVYVVSGQKTRREHLTLWGAAILVVAAAGIIVANAIYGYSFEFRPAWWLIASMGLIALSWYVGRRIMTGMRDAALNGECCRFRGSVGFLVAALGIWAALTSDILTLSNLGVSAAFGRAHLWLLPVVALGLAWLIGRVHDKGIEPARYGLSGALAAGLLVAMAQLWHGDFGRMAEDHSTLTLETLPYVAATAAIPPDATIGVHPHMLARHVEKYTTARVIHTMPEGLPLSKCCAPQEDAAVRCAMAGALCGITEYQVDYLLVKDESGVRFFQVDRLSRRN